MHTQDNTGEMDGVAQAMPLLTLCAILIYISQISTLGIRWLQSSGFCSHDFWRKSYKCVVRLEHHCESLMCYEWQERNYGSSKGGLESPIFLFLTPVCGVKHQTHLAWHAGQLPNYWATFLALEFCETESHYVAQVDLELVISWDLALYTHNIMPRSVNPVQSFWSWAPGPFSKMAWFNTVVFSLKESGNV